MSQDPADWAELRDIVAKSVQTADRPERPVTPETYRAINTAIDIAEAFFADVSRIADALERSVHRDEILRDL